MIPYFIWNTIHFGPLTFQIWGLFVSAGALIALFVARRIARTQNLSMDTVLDLFFWLLLCGLVGGRIFYVIFYDPIFFAQNPWEIFMVWHGGASSLGGWFGAALAAYLYCRINKIKWLTFLQYADVLSLGLWLGWSVGRIGCFMIHDHIGVYSKSFLAVAFPSGARLDLGLIESLLSLAVFMVFILLYKKIIHRPGRIFICSFILYSTIRFFMDFWRATDIIGADIRYAFLTPAQWGMLAMVIVLTFLLFRDKIRQRNTL